MSAWIYEFCDLLTGVPITTLELDKPQFASQIIVPGSFSATIQVTNKGEAERVRQVFPAPLEWPPPAGSGRVRCDVYQGPTYEEPWDSYIVWEDTTRGSDRTDGGTIEIRGAQIASYLHHRTIWDDLAFAQEDQIDIAHALVADMQAEPGGDLGIGIQGALSGVLRDRTYLASEAATYGQRLTELASVDGGFEWIVRTSLGVGGRPVHDFVTGYPNLADPATDPLTELEVSRPGNLLAYSVGASALNTGTRWRGRGDTVNDDITQTSEALLGNIMTAMDFVGAGWPYLDQTLDYQGVLEVATLDAYARWWRDTRSGVVRVPDLTVRFDDTLPIHPHLLGNYVQVTIVDLLNPLNPDGSPSFRARWRVVGMEVTPKQRGQGSDTARLVLEEARTP
ncbi:hypothetical protein IMZ11_33655 [Microtetraspora sp. AC03309]|uniref:hypothetical protein n=1 Tax=Microtetraspora sp. AC03309 TaxID=2779376 RepID=UPI001E315EA0|nr:hypothetical protein [Microtetraspora sp. AC03309]MCC5580575.1 hypothetical protein [Microtetraspora sp. AC03309]